MTRADTIARLLNQAGEYLKAAACPGNPQVYATSGPALSIDAAMRCINAAFLECLGGAAVAGEANGPPEPAPRFVPSPTPPPPKPAGWVVRHSGGPLRWLCRGPAGYEPYATREDAQRIADTTGGEPVPVDAAGNVIEAEDIGATLRREECERKAARQSGVAWEAARAGEEAERLRTDLAAVKAERDEVRAERDKWAANAGTLNASLRQVHTECDQLRAELDAPVVRDHSGVIAQCEEALRESSGLVIATDVMRPALRAALSALRGAS